MKSNDLAANTAASCVLALVFTGVMLSQDAAIPTQEGLQLISQGRYREAEEHLLHALEITGPDSSTAVYNLASLYQRQGRLHKAERLHRLALEHIERLHGPFDPAVAQSLNDLGAIYRSRGRYSQAIDVLERAAGVLDRNPPQRFACSVLNNLGSTYGDLGGYAKASAFLIRALRIAESGECEDHSDLGYILSSLGGLHFQQKQYIDAETAFRKAVLTFDDTLGSQHPDYALALTNLAVVYQRQKRLGEALPLLESSIDILERRFGLQAPLLAATLGTCGEVLKALGRKSEARQFLRRAHSIATPTAGTVDIKALKRQQH